MSRLDIQKKKILKVKKPAALRSPGPRYSGLPAVDKIHTLRLDATPLFPGLLPADGRQEVKRPIPGLI